MSIDVVLADLREELAALFGAGLATPGPARASALRGLAETLSAAGMERTAAELEEVATTIDAVVAGASAPDTLYERVQRIATWERQFRRAWSLRARRQELARAPTEATTAPARPPGIGGRVVPLGITAIDGRILFVARHVDSGDPLVLHDDWPGERTANPLNEPQPSRLFQEPIVPADALAQLWQLEDHPAVKRRGRWVAGPSFFTRPRLVDEPVPTEAMPQSLRMRWTSDGALLYADDDAPLELLESATLDFNLRKQRVFGEEIDVRLAESGHRRAIIAMAGPDGRPCFPSVDPAAIRWPRERLRKLADAVDHAGVRALVTVALGEETDWEPANTFGAAVASWLAGRPGGTGDAEIVTAAVGEASPALAERLAIESLPPDPTASDVVCRVLGIPDPAGRQSFVRAHATQLARDARRGGVLPPGRDLWLIAALARQWLDDDSALRIVDRERLRLAAVGPLVRALRGGAVPAFELEDALAIIVGWRETERFFSAP
ncbi:MAG: hypothetical protein AAF211_29075, partial [Myxococcota bacterium]